MTRFLKPTQSFTQNLASAALSFTTDFDSKAFHLDEITFHFNQAVSETITITLDSNKGAAYDTVLQEPVLVSETDYVFRPQGRAHFHPGDEIKVQCTNTGAAGTVSGEVKKSEVGG